MKTVLVSAALCLGVSLAGGAGSATTSRTLRAHPSSASPPVSVVNPPKLAVRNVHYHCDSNGVLWYYGEIVNTGTTDASAVNVVISLYNRQGQRLRSSEGVAAIISDNVLPPGATGVWIATFAAPATWSHARIEFGERLFADDVQAHNYTRVKAVGVMLGSANPGYPGQVTGRVLNTGHETAKVDEIIAAFYDKSGTLVHISVGGQLDHTSQDVPAGGSAPFLVGTDGYRGKPARVVVYVRTEKEPRPGGFAIG